MKPATIAIASVAGTLGVVAAIGFAQPDGLQPPAGPVDDTQPSLATIDARVQAIEQAVLALAGSEAPSQIEYVERLDIGNSTSLLNGSVLLDRVIVSFGEIQITDANGISFTTRSGVEGTDQLGLIETDPFVYELNTVLQAPLQIQALPNVGARFFLVYKELP
ncbi:MAG: hypothetical protein AAFN41_07375 [Planctomycetota bacterium]